MRASEPAETAASATSDATLAGLCAGLRARGPLAVKLGQYLALRPDVLTRAHCRVLLALTDRSAPRPMEAVLGWIDAALEARRAEALPWIGARPVAAGPLSQTHVAHGADGHEVLVKVRVPDAEAALGEGLGAPPGPWRAWLAGVPGLAAIEVPALERDFSRWLRDEADLERELEHLLRLSASTDAPRWLRWPRAYRGLSTPGVLVTEYQAGVPLSELLDEREGGRAWQLRTAGIDRDQVAEHLLRAVLDQLLRGGRCVADLHPENLLVLPDGALAFRGFGHLATLEGPFRPALMQVLRAVEHTDLDLMFDGFIDLSVASERSDRGQLRSDFQRACTDEPGHAAEPLPVARHLLAYVRAARAHQVELPEPVLVVLRTLVTAEHVAFALCGRAELAARARALIDRLQWEGLMSGLGSEALQPALLDGIGLLTDGPRNARRVLTDLADGRMVLRVRTVESDADRRQADTRARLITAAGVSVGLAVLLSATRGTLAFGLVPWTWLLGALLIAVWAWIVMLWRRL